MTIVYIGLGANLDNKDGNKQDNIQSVLQHLKNLPQTQLLAHSDLFQTAPIDAEGEDFINAVAQLETSLTAHALLQALQDIENKYGRTRPYANAPRSMDLDILLYGARKFHESNLVVPHPRLTQRAFALLPLLQLDPFIDIPGQGPAHQFVMALRHQTIQKISNQLFQPT